MAQTSRKETGSRWTLLFKPFVILWVVATLAWRYRDGVLAYVMNRNQLLEILDAGCRTHPTYLARRRPTKPGCERCEFLWTVRGQLTNLTKN